MDATDLFLLVMFAFSAGCIDAIAGGGGLIQIPGLLFVLPEAAVASLMGTNKASSIAGTAMATVNYFRHHPVPWGLVGQLAIAAMIASGLGAYGVYFLSPEVVKPIVIVALAGVLVFSVLRKDQGNTSRSFALKPKEQLSAAGLVTTVGFYDGFLGAGTGGFLIFGFTHLGFSYLQSATLAKVINLATNFAALAYFIYLDAILWEAALPMAAANIAGGYVGSKLSIGKGHAFIRRVFLAVVAVVLFKLGAEVVW